jgi:hypothetical protein
MSFVVGVVSAPSWALAPSAVMPLTQQGVLAGASSIQLRLLTYLARGDIAGAIVLYEAETGHPPPAWLLNLQGAYSTANQVVGKCQQVARTIHTAFTELQQKPQYIAFKAKADEEFIVFDLASGNSPSITKNGYHVAVRLGERIYDAYTGPLGMTWKEYLSRLHAQQGIQWEVVMAP